MSALACGERAEVATKMKGPQSVTIAYSAPVERKAARTALTNLVCWTEHAE
jgi:hypothetical protein